MPTVKIKETDIPIILQKLESGQTQTDVAKEYGVSQTAISDRVKKHALAVNGNSHPTKPNGVGIRSFFNKALDASEDAKSWKQVDGKTDTEWQLAIDAAERAASAWKAAATELNNRREK